MTYEAERQVKKALRSLPWYLFLVPVLYTLWSYLGDSALVSTSHWDDVFDFIKIGFFLWVIRQLLRLFMFRVFRNTREAIEDMQLTRR